MEQELVWQEVHGVTRTSISLELSQRCRFVPKKPTIRRSRRVRSRRTRKAESRGHCHQIGERVSLHLSHHLTPVGLYRDLADVELATDLFIQQARGYQGHDLPFARRERRVTVPERP